MWLRLFIWDPPKLRMETCYCKKTVVFAIENVWIALICRRYDCRAYSLHLTIIRVSSVIILCIMEISCCITWQCLEAEKGTGLVGVGETRDKRCLSFSPTIPRVWDSTRQCTYVVSGDLGDSPSLATVSGLSYFFW